MANVLRIIAKWLLQYGKQAGSRPAVVVSLVQIIERPIMPVVVDANVLHCVQRSRIAFCTHLKQAAYSVMAQQLQVN